MESTGTNSAVNTENDIEKIKETMDGYKKSSKDNDFETWLNLWDENGVVMMPDAPAASGKREIRELLETGFLNRVAKQFRIDVKEIHVTGGWGFARANYEIDHEPKDADPFIEVGKALTIFKKHADNSWKIYIDCFNYH